MKFLKYLGISIAAIIVLFLISFVITLASSESTEETIELERITITEPTKSFMEVELKSPGKDPYIVGKCNFPDSTDLSVSLVTNGLSPFSGGGRTEYGKFRFPLKTELINSDTLSIMCTKHKNFHSSNVFKQLQLIDSGTRQIDYRFSMLDLKRDFYQKLFGYVAPQEIDMSTVKVEDWTREISYPKKGIWKRIHIEIKMPDSTTKDEAINQMKHVMVEELAKDPTLMAIEAYCTRKKSSTRLYFAPNGDWNSMEYEHYSDYKLITDEIY